MDMEEILENCGLEKKEATVYIELLRLGEATATKLSQETSLDRTLMYQIANKLINKGLASYVIKDNVKYFIPVHPKQLLQNMEEKTRKLEAALPRLAGLAKEKESETKLEAYKGKEGLRAIIKDIIRTGQNYLVLGEEGKLQEILPLDLEVALKKIARLNIREKVLIREDFRGKILKSPNSEFRYIPKNYLSPATTIIYGDKVAHLLFSHPFHAVLATNKELAASFRSHFELLWKIAKK